MRLHAFKTFPLQSQHQLNYVIRIIFAGAHQREAVSQCNIAKWASFIHNIIISN